MYVITGGGRGLGRSLALELAHRKCPVLIIGRDEQALLDTAQQTPLISYCCADVSTVVGREKILHTVAQATQIQGLIHNAGIIEPILSIRHISLEAWRTCMATNVEAPLFLTQGLLPQLKTARVLHIGSGAAYFPIQGWSAYCTSKAALAMLTRSWQLEEPELLLASVMPGIIDTAMQDMIRAASPNMDPNKHAFFCELKATGRLLSPETVATFLAWLLVEATPEQYIAQEWDIYDVSHHAYWLRPPYHVPDIQ